VAACPQILVNQTVCSPARQTAKIAANCIRSLLLQPSPTPADHSIARYLFPRLINFVTTAEPEDEERARPIIAHTLVQYVGIVQPERVPVAMALVVPTLLARASSEGEDVYRETSARLLELAAVDQGAFRSVVAAMSGSQKSFLEEVIRRGRQSNDGPERAGGTAEGQPTIALKMDFGG
jgi:hypothetical protein